MMLFMFYVAVWSRPMSLPSRVTIPELFIAIAPSLAWTRPSSATSISSFITTLPSMFMIAAVLTPILLPRVERLLPFVSALSLRPVSRTEFAAHLNANKSMVASFVEIPLVSSAMSSAFCLALSS